MLMTISSSSSGTLVLVPDTCNRVKQLFACLGLKQSAEEFVKQCQICQQAETERIKSPGLLEPLPIPSQAWEL